MSATSWAKGPSPMFMSDVRAQRGFAASDQFAGSSSQLIARQTMMTADGLRLTACAP